MIVNEVVWQGRWQGDSLAPVVATALTAIDRRIAADHQRLLNEELTMTTK